MDSVTGTALESQSALAAKLSTMVSESATLDTVVQSAQSLDEETIRRLESLGYVGTIAQTDEDSALLDPKEMMLVAKQIDRANNLARAGRYEQALKLLTQASEVSPRDPVLMQTLARTYLFMDRVSEAETMFRAARDLKPDVQVSIFLAQILLADQRLDQAATLLDEAQKLDPHHGGIYLARGDLFAIQVRPDEALASYRRAAEVDPHRASTEARRRILRIEELLRIAPP